MREIVTNLICDITGKPAVETIKFGWDGRAYEIDLDEKNVEKFTKAVAPFVEVARPVVPTGGARKHKKRPNDLTVVRAWAAGKGYEVAARGRIRQDILDEFIREQG